MIGIAQVVVQRDDRSAVLGERNRRDASELWRFGHGTHCDLERSAHVQPARVGHGELYLLGAAIPIGGSAERRPPGAPVDGDLNVPRAPTGPAHFARCVVRVAHERIEVDGVCRVLVELLGRDRGEHGRIVHRDDLILRDDLIGEPGWVPHGVYHATRRAAEVLRRADSRRVSCRVQIH